MKFYSITSEKERKDNGPIHVDDLLIEPEDCHEGEDLPRGAEAKEGTKALSSKSKREIRKIVSDFNKRNGLDRGIAITSGSECAEYYVALRDNAADPVAFLNELLASADPTDVEKEPVVREVDFDFFTRGVEEAEDEGVLFDGKEIYRYLDVSLLRRFRNDLFSDRIVELDMRKDDLYRRAEEMHLGKEYLAELDRIYSIGKVERFCGHPAHYMIVARDDTYRKSVTQGLISALYENGRLSTKRYTIVMLEEGTNVNLLETVYRMDRGGAVLLRPDPSIIAERSSRGKGGTLDDFLEIVRKHAADTLTFFNFEMLSDSERDTFRTRLGNFALAEFRPDVYVKEEAVDYFRRLAVADGLMTDDVVVERIRNCESGYVADKLDELYAEWKSRYVSTVLYPEYRDCFAYGTARSDQEEGSAYAELMDLIGLDKVKKIIDDALNYFKLRHECQLRGLSFAKPNMHMAFTGNPGTAKTTVARLVARIFKENGLLSVGELVEVGRNDLVGKYVGHTAKCVKDAFDRARGSVLFIDEAYSLVDDRRGLYGDEAINTIVQLMENYRDDMVVIFAGYTKEMQSFLERNSGLRSRVAFHVEFDDYDVEELCDITELLARKNCTTLDPKVRTTLAGIYREEMQKDAFGNGRFARSLFERAKINLGRRLKGRSLSEVTNQELTTLYAEDFLEGMKCEGGKCGAFRIGFGA